MLNRREAGKPVGMLIDRGNECLEIILRLNFGLVTTQRQAHRRWGLRLLSKGCRWEHQMASESSVH